MQVIFLLSQTSSCAALRAADLGLSGHYAFAQWHSFAYLIFVIFFTRAKFLENKIYTEIYIVNCQFTQ